MHEAALAAHGPSPVHRYSFVNVRAAVGGWSARFATTERSVVDRVNVLPVGATDAADEGGLQQ